MRKKNALLHGKTLFVVTTRDAKDISLPFIAKSISGNLLGYFLVVEDTADGENEMDKGKQSDGTHVFLSSSTSISFWFPVAGSENSQPVSRQCCWPCLLAMLNFILSRGKSARTRHTLAWLKQGLCCTAASATSASSDNYAARIRICITHHNQGQDYIDCEFLACPCFTVIDSGSEPPWVVCMLPERAFVSPTFCPLCLEYKFLQQHPLPCLIEGLLPHGSKRHRRTLLNKSSSSPARVILPPRSVLFSEIHMVFPKYVLSLAIRFSASSRAMVCLLSCVLISIYSSTRSFLFNKMPFVWG